MTRSQSNSLTISKRRLMLYKAIQEFPDNQRIRSAFLRTHASEHVQVASQSGVYINYNQIDDLFALELDTEIRQHNVNVWMDQIDIEPDQDWDYAVSNALNRCGVMILVLSPHAVEDEQLQQEATAFLESGKVVIPVVHEQCDYEALNLLLPPIDFSQNFSVGFQQLLRAFTGESAVNA